MAPRLARDLFWCAGAYDLPPGLPTFGSEIDDVVRASDHVHLVFDHDGSVALLHEALQQLEQVLDIGEVQSCGWLIEQV